MSFINYSLRVTKKTFSEVTGGFEFDPDPVVDTTVHFDSSQNPAEAAVPFDGFTLEFRAFLKATQIEYELKKPGHPLNGHFCIGYGLVSITPTGSGETTLQQLEAEINISLTEKFRITLNP